MSDIGFAGRVAIVTGAGNGMGRTYALELARRGAQVIVNDVGVDPIRGGGSKDPANAVVEEIRAAGGQAVASFDSVATEDGGNAIAQTALDAFGRIDILINNAAIMTTGLIADLRREDIESNINVLLYGSIYPTIPAFRAMKKNGYGRIVFVSSNGATFGRTSIAAYASAKAAVIGLMITAAHEGAAHGILANALTPGALTRQSAAFDEDVKKEVGSTDDAAATDREQQITHEALEVMKDAMKPEFVTPMTLYLASEACTQTRSSFSALGGRYAHLFTGITPGWIAPDDKPPTIEDVAAHMDQILNQDGYQVPLASYEELIIVANARKALREA